MKEIEVKVLDIDIILIKKKLENLGAKFQGETLQKIHTYDLFPISTSFVGIIATLKKNIGNKENELARERLVALLSDLSDLLTDDERKAMITITGFIEFEDFIKIIELGEIPQVIYSELFYNIVNNHNTNPNKWVRLRESNGKTTITLKQIFGRKVVDGIRYHSIDGVKEIEIQIDNAAVGNQLLQELGYYSKNYQEKKRISYLLPDNIEIDIDQWPHIPPYLEIEAPSRELVYSTLYLLGFKDEDAKFLNADDVFTSYGLNMYNYKELRF